VLWLLANIAPNLTPNPSAAKPRLTPNPSPLRGEAAPHPSAAKPRLNLNPCGEAAPSLPLHPFDDAPAGGRADLEEVGTGGEAGEGEAGKGLGRGDGEEHRAGGAVGPNFQHGLG